MVEAIAAGLGYTVRGLLIFLRVLPGIAGPVAIVVGLWWVYPPAGLIMAGLILTLADLRIGRIRPTPEAGK